MRSNEHLTSILEINGMTLPPLIRVFFALDLPLAAKTTIAKFIVKLKQEPEAEKIKWTRRENFHITLQFLDEINSADLEKLILNVKEMLRQPVKLEPFSIGPIQIFPNLFRPRVISFEIFPQTSLALLSHLIGLGIQKTGYTIDPRAYKAHLTLGRIKQMNHIVLGFLQKYQCTDVPPITIKKITLYRSEPQAEGSHYTELAIIPLEDS